MRCASVKCNSSGEILCDAQILTVTESRTSHIMFSRCHWNLHGGSYTEEFVKRGLIASAFLAFHGFVMLLEVLHIIFNTTSNINPTLPTANLEAICPVEFCL